MGRVHGSRVACAFPFPAGCLCSIVPSDLFARGKSAFVTRRQMCASGGGFLARRAEYLVSMTYAHVRGAGFTRLTHATRSAPRSGAGSRGTPAKLVPGHTRETGSGAYTRNWFDFSGIASRPRWPRIAREREAPGARPTIGPPSVEPVRRGPQRRGR